MEGSASHLSLVKRNYNSQKQIENWGGKYIFKCTSSPGAEGIEHIRSDGCINIDICENMHEEICIDFKLHATKVWKIMHDFPFSKLDGKTCVLLTILSKGNVNSQPIAFTCRPFFRDYFQM